MERRTFLKRSAQAAASLALTPWMIPDLGKSLLSLKRDKDLEIVTLTGSPLNRGHIHGETLKTKINYIVKRWKHILHRQ